MLQSSEFIRQRSLTYTKRIEFVLFNSLWYFCLRDVLVTDHFAIMGNVTGLL